MKLQKNCFGRGGGWASAAGKISEFYLFFSFDKESKKMWGVGGGVGGKSKILTNCKKSKSEKLRGGAGGRGRAVK